MSNVDINVDRRTDGRTDGRKIGRLYRTLLQAGAIKIAFVAQASKNNFRNNLFVRIVAAGLHKYMAKNDLQARN